MKGIVYSITNSINGKRYIGMARKGFKARYRVKWWLRVRNPHLLAAIAKYGSENFAIETLFESDDPEELKVKERFFIEKYNSLTQFNGYNMALGGEGGNPGKEACEKISKTLIEYYKSKEARDLMSERVKAAFEKDPTYRERMIASLKKRYADNPELRNECAAKQGCKPFQVFSKETGELVGVWKNRTLCAEELNLYREKIRDCIKGKRKSTGGYVFKEL